MLNKCCAMCGHLLRAATESQHFKDPAEAGSGLLPNSAMEEGLIPIRGQHGRFGIRQHIRMIQIVVQAAGLLALQGAVDDKLGHL